MVAGWRRSLLGNFGFIAVLALSGSAAAEPCDEPSTPDGLEASLASAEQAFATLDVAMFSTSAEQANVQLVCLRQPLDQALAARYHRLEGLVRYRRVDKEGSHAAAGAAKALEPGYTFPPDYLPAGHPYRLTLEGIDPSSGTFQAVPPPTSGGLLFDGTPGDQRPTSRATILQVQDAEGAIVTTRYLMPDDGLPDYPHAAQPDPTGGPPTTPPTEGQVEPPPAVEDPKAP